jgi:small subunit ribosomal protein S11
MPAKKTTTKRKKLSPKTNVSKAKVYITATFNNTIVTFTDLSGDTLCWQSAGASGFKGARKSTPFAAITAVTQAAEKASLMGVKDIEVYIKGPGPGRDASLKALRTTNLNMTLIADLTPIPHNGPRPKKKRRV